MDSETLGRNIASQRQQRGWSQTELGERSGLAQEYVSKLERGGTRRVPFDVVHRIAAALGVSPDLLTGPKSEVVSKPYEAPLDEDDCTTMNGMLRNLFRLRDIAGLTRSEMSKMTGLPTSTIVRMEQGQGLDRVSVGVAIALRKALLSTGRLRPDRIATKLTAREEDAALSAVAPASRESAADDRPIIQALFRVYPSTGYPTRIFDGARKALESSRFAALPDESLDDVARSFLVAANRVHKEGRELTPSEILTQVVVGSIPGARAREEEQRREINEAADAQAKSLGLDTASSAGKVQEALAKRKARRGHEDE